MAVINKNFVIKNGLEVNNDLVFANAVTDKVGIGTTNPQYTLHVNGGIGATSIYVTGITTLGITSATNLTSQSLVVSGVSTTGTLNVGTGGTVFTALGIGGSVGVGTANPAYLFDIRSPVSTGQTALYVKGDVRFTGDLNIGDGSLISLNATGFSTFTGSSVFKDYVSIEDGVNVGGISSLTNVYINGSLSAGNTTGTAKQVLLSTGIGITWSILSKSSSLFTANEGQTTFSFLYEVGTAEVYVNGIRLSPDEYVANNGSNVVLNFPCFGNETVEILSNQTAPTSTIGITVRDESNLLGQQNSTKIINFTGRGVSAASSTTPNQVDVSIDIFNAPGKTIYVTKNGNDSNDGLTLDFAKASIKSASLIAIAKDTIKVSPGTYTENNPITLAADVSVEGAELRNCIIVPQNTQQDLFLVSNGVHMTDLSFVGVGTTTAAVIAFKPLVGVASDRFFDAARIIRYNLDFIAAESVGYLTSTDYRNPPFSLNSANYTSCKDDIKDVYRAVCHDIVRGGNSKCVGAGLSYYPGGLFAHVVGVKTETIDALKYSAGIARAIVNNVTWGSNPVGVATAVTNAVYSNTTGITTITAINHGLSINNAVKVIGLGFTCPSGPGIVTFPSGYYGYIFNVRNVVGVNTFEVVVGQSTLPHTYVSGGTVQKYENFQNNFTQVKDLGIQNDPTTGHNNAINGCSNVVSAIYTCVGIVTSIIKDGPNIVGTQFNLMYPGNAGIGTTNPNDIPSQGVGNVTKGPYIRNCTNFIFNSIGMKIDGFHADSGDKDDIGVTGSMSVDSYTQYNQGGIGVEISNGAYAQLVSIFTICTDKGIVTIGGGQCDITNSNSSFGTQGLISDGVSDSNSLSPYRYTGEVSSSSDEGDFDIVISGIGNEKPYSGQVVYFDELYYEVSGITVTNGGSGYTSEPVITINSPTESSGITAEALSVIENGKITSINMIGNGRNYKLSDTINVTIAPALNGASAVVNLKPLYYTVLSATTPLSGISTVTFIQPLNNDVGIGSTVFFFRQSLQIVSSHSFEYIGAGNTIELARPSKGGTTISENEVVLLNGGSIVYTSTDQDGNFAIGKDLIIDQATGTITGRAFQRSLLNTVTPFIIALGTK